MNTCKFSQWQIWEAGPKFDFKSLIETLDGGQSFAWSQKESYLEGVFNQMLVRLKLEGSNLAISVPESYDIQSVYAHLSEYFALDIDFKKIRNDLPWRSDPILKTAMTAFPKLRILRQPLGDTLFGFLCSSTKQIPQIKEIVHLSSKYYGKEIFQGYHALPSWKTLSSLSEANLRALKLGYRARYIYQSAQHINANPNLLLELSTLSTIEAKQALLNLPGIGSKIADCILLFALSRLESFPIDTWIEKILKKAYGLEGFSRKELQSFAKAHFGEYAGYAQQFLFSAARSRDLKL